MYLLSISVVRLTVSGGEQERVQFGVDNPGFYLPGFSLSPFPSSESVSYLIIIIHNNLRWVPSRCMRRRGHEPTRCPMASERQSGH